MLDDALQQVRRVLHQRRLSMGEVEQARGAGQLFRGDFSSVVTVGEEFAGSRLGLGVMHDLAGEVISIHGKTWRVPVDGVPLLVDDSEGIAFGVAAHGGRERTFTLAARLDVDAMLLALDGYLAEHHVDHENVVCAVEISGHFTQVMLRTVAPPTNEDESLSDVIDAETRFTFADWEGTLVGFRFPDHTTGETIPGLHLHGLSRDLLSGGHLREATTREVTTRIWVDELLPVVGRQEAEDVTIDFARYEGSPSE